MNNSSTFSQLATSTFSERYKCVDLERFPVRDNLELVYSKYSRSTKILPSDMVELLSRCQTFETLENHLQKFCSELHLNQEQKESIKSQLSELIDAGFMISCSALLDYCKHSANTQNSPKAIASMGMPTRDQVDVLKRGLSSYIENSKQYGRDNDFVVVDDSESADTRNSYRQLLQLLKSRYDVKIFYAGQEEKIHFTEALIRKGLPPDVVNFALFDVEKVGKSTGANRNALLLHTIGDTFFSADTDMVCRIAATPELNNSLAFISRIDPMEWWIFPNRETTLNSVTFVERDIFAIHEQLLGKDLRSCVSSFNETTEVDFNQIDARSLASIAEGRGKVLATFNGLVGDCSFSSPLIYLFLRGESHKRLVESESHYRSALTSREILEVSARTTISNHPVFCCTGSVGFDNRELLPPFIPVGRRQDVEFGRLLSKCFEDAHFGYLPWAILHAPPETRSFSDGAWWKSLPILTHIIGILTKSFEFSPKKSSAKERMRLLGSHLMELGSMSLPDFEECVLIARWRWASSLISSLENRLHVSGESPDFWANDAKKYLATLQGDLLDAVVPIDLIGGRSVDEARELTQRFVFKFGQLLYEWPEIVEATSELRNQGYRLAKTI